MVGIGCWEWDVEWLLLRALVGLDGWTSYYRCIQ